MSVNEHVETNEMLIERAGKIIARIEFINYHIFLGTGHGGVYLRASYLEADIYGGPQAEKEIQYTRKWLLSPHMTESEIVFTSFKCCATSFEHRSREYFTYKGARIAGPHFNVNDLVALCITHGRENAGGRK